MFITSAKSHNPWNRFVIVVTVCLFGSRLRSCALTMLSFTYLREAIKANPSHLTELHLMGNQFKDVAIPILTSFKKDRSFKMAVLE